MSADLWSQGCYTERKVQRDVFIAQSEGCSFHAPGYITTVWGNKGTRTMFQDCKRWKEQKMSYRNEFLWENSGINYSQTNPHFHLEVNWLTSKRSLEFNIYVVSMTHPGYRPVTIPGHSAICPISHLSPAEAFSKTDNSCSTDSVYT